jgi:hypothetical protein
MEKLQRATKLAEETGGGILYYWRCFECVQQVNWKRLLRWSKNTTPFISWWCTWIWYTENRSWSRWGTRSSRWYWCLFFNFAKSMANIGALLQLIKTLLI